MPVTRGDLTVAELVEALRAYSRGVYAAEASTELLIEHGSWLGRSDFLDHVEVQPAFVDALVSYASINWETLLAADPPCSSGEWRILRIAASLAGYRVAEPLGELVSSLDEANLAAVLRAVLHACRGGRGPAMTVHPF
jgi:hypothetical protein